MTVVWDDDRGELVELRVGGRPVSDERRYELAAAESLFRTNHLVRAVGTEDVTRTVRPDEPPVLAYAREFGVDPRIEGRIVRQVASSMADD
jgi:hypothetical protein